MHTRRASFSTTLSDPMSARFCLLICLCNEVWQRMRVAWLRFWTLATDRIASFTRKYTSAPTSIVAPSAVIACIQKKIFFSSSTPKNIIIKIWSCSSCMQKVPLPPTDSIIAMLFVWRLRRKSELIFCCIVYDSCAKWQAQTCEQFLQLTVGLVLGFFFYTFGPCVCVLC